MRKFLILTLFFVTLLPLSPRFGCATVHAQGIANENYYLCYVNGFVQMSLYPCSDGHEVEIVKCTKCGEQYMSYESHDCQGDEEEKIWCPHCNAQLTPEEYATHNCLKTGDGDEPDGGNSGGGGGGSGGSVGSGGDDFLNGIWNPNNNNNNTTIIINPPSLPEEIHKPAENEVLFKDNLPAQTIKQRTNMDCVSTSLGIISELSGSVQTAENVRENIEEMYRRMTGVLLEEDGVDSSCYLNMLLTESGLPYEYTSPLQIKSSIDSNMPVLGIIEASDGFNKHMVVIVGYYNEFYVSKYQCINPGTGQYETHSQSEFYVKDIDGNNTITTYVYSKY